MRAMDLAIMFAFFNIAIGMMAFMSSEYPDLEIFDNDATHSFMGQTNMLDAQLMQSKATTQATDLSNAGNNGGFINQVFGWFGELWHGFFYALTIFISIFQGMLFGTKIFLMNMSIPETIADLIQMAVWIIYAIGISQYIAGRSTKEAS